MATVVVGTVKDYPWGMVDGMVPWTGRGTGKPQAELWFGTHHAGPSPTLDGSTADVALAGVDVPLLVKILAASNPLSLQIHPDAAMAARCFADQGPGEALFTDPVAKHELLVAMSDFTALAGWRPPTQAAGILRSLGYSDEAVSAAAVGSWAQACRLVLSGLPHQGPWDPSRVRRAIPAGDDREAIALGDIAATYPGDPGVGLAAILAFVTLQAGEALYLPAGTPHAYLRGVGLEVMAASDNVLRMGLTNKTVAAPQALRAIREDLSPLLLPDPGPKAPPNAPFRVLLQRGVAATMASGNYRVVLAIDGTVTVTIDGAAVELSIGQAMLIPAADSEAEVASDAMVAMVEAVGMPASTQQEAGQ
jgi:mannose-6-phosphate isomerase